MPSGTNQEATTRSPPARCSWWRARSRRTNSSPHIQRKDATLELLFREGSDPRRDIPIRSRIGGLDLLGMAERSDTTEAPIWLPLPLIGMALLGMRAVRQAQAVGRAALELDDSGEALLFLAEADTVLLHSTLTERTARVPFAVLHEAWERFATDAVREFARWYPHEAARYESGLAKALTDDPTTFGTSAWRFFDEENRHGFDHVDAVEP